MLLWPILFIGCQLFGSTTLKRRRKRIYGGNPANIVQDRSFMVAISIFRTNATGSGRDIACGGVYIQPRIILSSASCMFEVIQCEGVSLGARRISGTRFKAVGGTGQVLNMAYLDEVQLRDIDKSVPHPKFEYKTKRDNVGFFRITRPFEITSYITYAPFSTEYRKAVFKGKATLPYLECSIYGFGTTHNDIRGTLQVAQIGLEPPDHCISLYPHEDDIKWSRIFCTGTTLKKTYPCRSDDGSALVCDGVVMGILEVNSGLQSNAGCGEQVPFSYSRYEYYEKYIDKNYKYVLRLPADKDDSCVLSTPQIAPLLYCFIEFTLIRSL